MAAAAGVGGAVVAGGGMAAAAPAIAVGAAAFAACIGLSVPCSLSYDRYTECIKDWSWYHPVCMPMFALASGSCVGAAGACLATGGLALKAMPNDMAEKMRKIFDVFKLRQETPP